jgi:hypothetical protein
LGKAQPNPQDGETYGNTYPPLPYVSTPLTLVKEKSYTRGESYMLETREEQVYKPNIPLDKQVNLVVLNYNSKQIYIYRE